MKMSRVSFRVTKMDKFRNVYIRETAQAEWFGRIGAAGEEKKDNSGGCSKENM